MISRASLPRTHGISRLPEIEGDKPAKKQKVNSYPIGYFHVDLAEVRTEEGKPRLFVAFVWPTASSAASPKSTIPTSVAKV